MSNLRWKLLTIIAVTIIFGAVGVYPIIAAVGVGLTKSPIMPPSRRPRPLPT